MVREIDLAGPTEVRSMYYTSVINMLGLQGICLSTSPEGMVHNGDGVLSYETNSNGHGVKAVMESGKTVKGDLSIGTDGIWSTVCATMCDEPVCGRIWCIIHWVHTVYAGKLNYDSFDNRKF